MTFSDTQIRKLETRENPYVLRDDRWLYLEVLGFLNDYFLIVTTNESGVGSRRPRFRLTD
jgi:hypothetical protein